MSEETRADNSTLEEQRGWVGAQFDSSIEVVGVTDGWYKTRKTVPWIPQDESRMQVLQSLFPDDCGSGESGRIDTALKNDEVEDPFGAAARIRALWESEGWVVTDVWSEPSPTEEYFRADRPDGAVLALQAAETGLSLEVSTACSLNSTVTDWGEYLDIPEETTREQLRPEGASP